MLVFMNVLTYLTFPIWCAFSVFLIPSCLCRPASAVKSFLLCPAGLEAQGRAAPALWVGWFVCFFKFILLQSAYQNSGGVAFQWDYCILIGLLHFNGIIAFQWVDCICRGAGMTDRAGDLCSPARAARAASPACRASGSGMELPAGATGACLVCQDRAGRRFGLPPAPAAPGEGASPRDPAEICFWTSANSTSQSAGLLSSQRISNFCSNLYNSLHETKSRL